MGILIPLLILFITPLLMVILRQLRPGFVYHWLVATGGTLAAWVTVLLAGTRLPQTVSLISVTPESLFSSWPLLMVDWISWPYAVAIVTLALAVVLTDVAR
ncbi:MAG TPA: hypothetical protein VJ436_01045, partial [Anaerolineales bacterium]|nr:hypothetical protein [Anaerolineales bacterium]